MSADTNKHPAAADASTEEHAATSAGEHVEESRNPAGLDTGLIVLVGIVGAILVYVTVLASTAAFYSIRENYVQATQTQLPPDRRIYDRQQNTLLNGTYWVNQEQGLVTIPIEQAMDIVAEQGLKSSN